MCEACEVKPGDIIIVKKSSSGYICATCKEPLNKVNWSGRYNRVLQWAKFNRQMELHIEQYTRQQYGTKDGNEQVDNFTIDDCWRCIERYYNRRGKNARGPVEELRDLLKIAHYAQLLYDKLKVELKQEDVYLEEPCQE